MKSVLSRLSPVIGMLCAVLLLGACTTPLPPPRVDVQGPMYVAPEAIAPAPARNGSIYQTTSYRPIFEDHRARLVGDTLTVQIVESVSASQKSNSTIDKSGSLKAGITALPGISSNSFGTASVGGSSSNTFAGKGETQNTNTFTGSISAIVTAVLPNGHLVIAGEKQIGVNHNVDVLRFSGQVDPRAIQSGNTVASINIANVRIEQRGRGQQAEAQGIGWLSRFFLNLLPI